MSIYEELAQEGAEWARVQMKYQKDSLDFIQAFGQRFKDHIGAPNSYRHAVTGRVGSPVVIVPVDYSDPMFPKFEDSGTADVLRKNDEGFWYTGMRVTVQGPGGQLPQLMSWFLITFRLAPDGCHITIWPEKNERVIDPNNPDTWKPVYDFMVRRLHEFRASKPWESEKQQGIGFLAAVP